MATVRVVLRKCRKNKDGRYPVAIRLTHNRKIKYIFTGFSCLENEWLGKYPNFANKRHPSQEELNLYLIQLYSKATNQLLILERKEKFFTVDDLYKSTVKESSKSSLYNFVEEQISKLRKSGSIGTAENYRTMINSIKRFMKDKDVCFEEINFKWLTEFEAYHYSRGNTSVSLSVYLRGLRAIYNRAIMYEVVDEKYYPFGRNKYRIPTGPTIKRAITKESIIKIENLILEKDSYLWHAKNYFLFSFYTMGMNWSDMAHLKIENIINERIEYIRLKTKRKTQKSFSIKINSKIREILNYYIIDKQSDEYIFPIIKRSSTAALIREDIKNRLRRYNKNLERIAKLCNIEDKLTSYVTRHSWATIAKKQGIGIGIISDALGHADIQVTQIYLDSFGNSEIDSANEEILGI